MQSLFSGRPKEVDVSDEEEVEEKEKPGITLQGILELVALGAGLSWHMSEVRITSSLT